MVLQAMGDYAGAKQMLERALKILERTLPLDHAYIKVLKSNINSMTEDGVE
jgi:hypothetical protein